MVNIFVDVLTGGMLTYGRTKGIPLVVMFGVLGDLTMIFIPWSLCPLYDFAGVKKRLPGIVNVDSKPLDFLRFLTAMAAQAKPTSSPKMPRQEMAMSKGGEKDARF